MGEIETHKFVGEEGRIVERDGKGKEEVLVANSDDEAERVPLIRRSFRSQVVDVFKWGG
jgi:hypothetical protein